MGRNGSHHQLRGPVGKTITSETSPMSKLSDEGTWTHNTRHHLHPQHEGSVRPARKVNRSGHEPLMHLRISSRIIEMNSITRLLRAYQGVVTGAQTFGEAVNHPLPSADCSLAFRQFNYQVTIMSPFLLCSRLPAPSIPLSNSSLPSLTSESVCRSQTRLAFPASSWAHRWSSQDLSYLFANFCTVAQAQKGTACRSLVASPENLEIFFSITSTLQHTVKTNDCAE